MTMRYAVADLADISITTAPVEGQPWGEGSLSFQQQQDNQFDLVLTLTNGEHAAQWLLPDIDLSLFIPKAPETAQGSNALTQWFLTERETACHL